VPNSEGVVRQREAISSGHLVEVRVQISSWDGRNGALCYSGACPPCFMSDPSPPVTQLKQLWASAAQAGAIPAARRLPSCALRLVGAWKIHLYWFVSRPFGVYR